MPVRDAHLGLPSKFALREVLRRQQVDRHALDASLPQVSSPREPCVVGRLRPYGGPLLERGRDHEREAPRLTKNQLRTLGRRCCCAASALGLAVARSAGRAASASACSDVRCGVLTYLGRDTCRVASPWRRPPARGLARRSSASMSDAELRSSRVVDSQPVDCQRTIRSRSLTAATVSSFPAHDDHHASHASHSDGRRLSGGARALAWA